ncbi:MAG TPA: maleylpyruvate isomerase N-terminal domain-containing protein [Chloroflexia bacterium]|nr:maleylpyruvate isomerase N-terminal domain-containing protein [Chloroflexia bacterium]
MNLERPGEMAPAESPRPAIRNELEATHAAFHQLLTSLSSADWRQKSADPAWTVGEQLSQIVDEVAAAPRTIESARRGQGVRPQPGMSRAVNARIARTMARNATPDSLGARYDQAHTALLALLDSIGDEEWAQGAQFFGVDETVASLFHQIAGQFQVRATRIQQGLGQHP